MISYAGYHFIQQKNKNIAKRGNIEDIYINLEK